MKTINIFAAMILTSGALMSGVGAEAQRIRSHSHTVRGPDGRGYTRSLQRSRGQGTGSTTHTLQTADGRGVTGAHQHQAKDGSFQSSRTRTLNDGTAWSRTTNGSLNGNGTADYSRTWTGPEGRSATRAGTVGTW